MKTLSALLIALLAGAPAARQLKLMASESFEYGQGEPLGDQPGGFGWRTTWWAGGAPHDNAVITSPGLDAYGYRATVNKPEGASYRTIDAGDWVQSTDADGKFGLDGQTIWVTVTQQRMAGGDDAWGGFSLFNNGGNPGEVMFIGAPFQFGSWGIDGPGVGGLGPGATPPIDDAVTMVVRVDFQAGDERVRLWIDPASAHPTASPGLDATFPDFVFNEVRIASGPGASAGTVSGWHFDSVTLECEGCPDGPQPPPPSTPNPLHGGPTQLSLQAGGVQTLQLDAGPAHANKLYLLMGSLSGAAPGLPVDGLVLPLNLDAYLLHTLQNVNGAPLFPSLALLDGSGSTTCTFTVPSGSNPAWAGAHFDHAFLVLDVSSGTPYVPFVSNAWGADLIP